MELSLLFPCYTFCYMSCITYLTDTREGASLYQFAQTVSWPAEDTEKASMALQSIDCELLS